MARLRKANVHFRNNIATGPEDQRAYWMIHPGTPSSCFNQHVEHCLTFCAMTFRKCRSLIQVNPNREELRPEQAHCPRIPCCTRQLMRQPVLAFAGIVLRE